MFRKTMTGVMLVAFVGFQSARADQILFDWAFNVDGIMTENLEGDAMEQAGFNLTGFDQHDGSGTVSFFIDAGNEGNHSIGSFFDIEVSEGENTYFNETASVSDNVPTDLTWEVDEPGYVDGDIYTNFVNNELDNSIFNGSPATIDDISVAMAWNFSLASYETATITFNILNSFALPENGFFIKHYDPYSDESAYITTSLVINGNPPPPPPPPPPHSVPEPATGGMLLLGSLLAGILAVTRKK